MNGLVHPTPLDREIKLDPSQIIMSKTDSRGIIEYANNYFMEICGYEEYELMGQPHSIIRHPDMPKVIFKVLWERINKGENIHALVKNLAKDGRYYWVLTNFETKYDEEGNIVSHYARRKAAPSNVIYQIEKLYKTLKAIEEKQNPETAERYFEGLLEEKGITYDEFILELLGVDENSLKSYFMDAAPKINQNTATTKKKSLFKRMFN
jgi:PAS domain S-box-containing protein